MRRVGIVVSTIVVLGIVSLVIAITHPVPHKTLPSLPPITNATPFALPTSTSTVGTAVPIVTAIPTWESWRSWNYGPLEPTNYGWRL